MGLDMYLSARRYTGEHFDPKANAKLKPIADDLLPPDGNFGSITVERDVAYWRKANQIHNWFVANVQDGNDDCGHYPVGIEKLKELRDAAQKVLDATKLVDGKVTNGWSYGKDGEKKPILEDGQTVLDKSVAEEVLPTKDGFFFGSTDYDQYYIEDLKSTVTQLDRIFAWLDANGRRRHRVEFQYHSSW